MAKLITDVSYGKRDKKTEVKTGKNGGGSIDLTTVKTKASK
jgi:hypothetical protein